MSLCKDCVRGVSHEGTPGGQNTVVNGVAVYIAKPTVDYPKDKAVLFLPDVFGKELVNAQLLADDFARNGFYCVIPDLFNGDALPPNAMNEPGFDIMKWFPNHGPEQTRPTLNKVMAGLQEQGVKEFAAVGYCFGGRYVFDLAFENLIKVAAVCHPSLLKIPADLETYLNKSKVPLLINSCTVDSQFPIPAQEKADQILGNGKFEPGYKREYFDGCTHGFAVRGDLSDPKVKAGKEGAFKATVEWFFKYI
ncbi:hypothetical protein AGABI2DRAFT_191660 [Agaricus bisporus var. bisporus H97]|uniref:hypothetical protein n=1 Tax=Agaricus bisporus var. bisporus (strain H97 / ATCC MYA-4626 / FGSC 10389) TaxID=936046 RepID=UPI00029F5947|nr:hypothetical protein AGABI2DRAFT_191660 [Agaricus bisporus var. bisporus H97]EKV47952.1 hypothetical protein AGABI2DRAFT_191660 [Agaricus bisporus var. bisporus H97]